MSKTKNISIIDLQNKLNTLSLTEVLNLLDSYSNKTGIDTSSEKKRLITNDLQSKLLENNINTNCPHCGSSNKIRKGTQGNSIRFLCKDCNKYSTLFTNTLLEKTKYPWEVWIKVLEMTINYLSLDDMVTVLKKDYKLTSIDRRTVMYWRHKLIHALAEMPMPKLNGVVQIDETFMRESQKGEKELVSFIKDEDRLPRYGWKPSQYGVMGPEWCTITTMVDLKGYCVCKVSGLGKLTVETFTDLFDSHLDNPSFICTDANKVYKQYCNVKGIPLYIRPSNYFHIIKKNGYETPDWSNPTKAKTTEENNTKILTKLYKEQLIDYIVNREELTYKEFNELKNANSLSLARVNELHHEIKEHLNHHMRNVSTKYLSDYVGFFTYIRNWRVTNGYYPSSLQDAESIFIEILKGKSNYTIKEQKETKLEIKKPSDKYIKLLEEKTKQIRANTKNPYFKYDNEDNVIGFDKRKYLEDLPKYKLEKLCSIYKIPHKWAKYCKISELLKQADLDTEIENLIIEYRHYLKDDEQKAKESYSKYA